VLFLGVHSVRIVADGWRTQTLARMGEMPWKGLYSLVSAVGLALIVWGYGLARQQPVVLWVPPIGMRHAAALLTLIAFVLLAATYVPRNAIKARLHHPMVLAVKTWALGHLISNGNLADVALFGGFCCGRCWTSAPRASATVPRARCTPQAVLRARPLPWWWAWWSSMPPRTNAAPTMWPRSMQPCLPTTCPRRHTLTLGLSSF